jgi:hypothetical protein
MRGIVAGESYAHKWDGRVAADTTPSMAYNSWIHARGAASGALRIEAETWKRSAVFLRASGIGVLFRSTPTNPVVSKIRATHRLEAGWRMPGGGAALELYVATERLFDDVMMPTPRPSRMTGVGLRLAEKTHF